MTHLRAKGDPRGYHVFACDYCGAVAGQSGEESEALRIANAVAEAYGWATRHPRYQFYCPQCKDSVSGLEVA